MGIPTMSFIVVLFQTVALTCMARCPKLQSWNVKDFNAKSKHATSDVFSSH